MKANGHWQSGTGGASGRFSPVLANDPPAAEWYTGSSGPTGYNLTDYIRVDETINVGQRISRFSSTSTYIKTTIKAHAPEALGGDIRLKLPQMSLSQSDPIGSGSAFLQIQGKVDYTQKWYIPVGRMRTSIATTWESGGALLPLTDGLILYFNVSGLDIDGIWLHATEVRVYGSSVTYTTAAGYNPSEWYYTTKTTTCTADDFAAGLEIAQA